MKPFKYQLPMFFISIAEPPKGYFRVEFLERTESKFKTRAPFTFIRGHSQEDIVCYRRPDDPSSMYEARDLIASSPQVQYRLFDLNPLKMQDFYLNEIMQGESIRSPKYCVYEYFS